jgi:hypothetical protein
MKNETDEKLISAALLMWKNFIETGDINMSKKDAVNCGDEKKIRHLDANQINFTDRLIKLSETVVENGINKKEY